MHAECACVVQQWSFVGTALVLGGLIEHYQLTISERCFVGALMHAASAMIEGNDGFCRRIKLFHLGVWLPCGGINDVRH